MPPHREPSTLQELVLTQVTNLIIRSCVNICSKFGDYESATCQRAANEVNEFLLPQVKPFLDCISNRVSHSDLYQLTDKRIFFAVIVHSSSKNVNLSTLLSRRSCDFVCYDMFCIETISKLNNLICLTISQSNVTEQTLSTIADVCSNTLQYFTVVPVMTDFNCCFCHLSKCKELKYLKIISVSLKTLQSQAIDRLRLLILSLPKLEYFDSGDMVKILSVVNVEYPYLSLKQLKEIDVDAQSWSNVVKICPKLQHIDIALHPSEKGSQVLKATVESELPLSCVKLRDFLWQEELNDLLRVKGACITQFVLDSLEGPFIYENIYIIGKNCPNLIILGLDVLDRFSLGPKSVTENKSPRPMFSKLQYLCFGWYRFGSHGQDMLALIMSNANNLNDLVLQCCTSLPNQDALDAVLCLNPLTGLTELSLIVNGPGAILQQSMSRLISHCQKLRGCYIYGHITKETRVFLQHLHGRIQDENLALQIDVFEK